MRVGIDYRPALLGQSGISRYVRELVRALPDALAAQGPPGQVELFAAFWKNVGERHLVNPAGGVRLHASRFPGRLLKYLGRWGLMSVESFTGPLELFHSTDFVELPVRCRRRVATIHDLGFLREPQWYQPDGLWRVRGVTEKLVAQSQVLVAISETTAEDIRDRFDCRGKEVVVTPLGVDSRFFDVPDPPEESLEVLMIGTLEPRKNHLRLIRAFARLRDRFPGARLKVLGRRGWLDQEIVDELKRMEHEGWGNWLGNASDHDLLAAMSTASLIVYPSLWEGFGLPVLEAMAAGRPVLTSNLGAMQEVAGTDALLVDPFSEEALTFGLEALLEDSGLRRRLGEAGRKRAAGFTWAQCARKTIEAWGVAMEMDS